MWIQSTRSALHTRRRRKRATYNEEEEIGRKDDASKHGGSLSTRASAHDGQLSPEILSREIRVGYPSGMTVSATSQPCGKEEGLTSKVNDEQIDHELSNLQRSQVLFPPDLVASGCVFQGPTESGLAYLHSERVGTHTSQSSSST